MPEADLRHILSCFKERSVRKNDYVLREGEIARDYFFIISGALRIYFNNDENEITAWIAFENDFFTDLSSIKKQAPSRFNIQAIENTVLTVIDADRMEMLYSRYPAWQQFGRNIWETAFLKLIDAIINFQTLTAEERYLAAMRQSNLLQRVSLKDLSSYLGITPTTLSRLRKKIR